MNKLSVMGAMNGAVETIRLPPGPAMYPAVARGADFVTLIGTSPSAYVSAASGGRIRDLGQATQVFAAVRPDAVWLLSKRASTCTAREVTTSGQVLVHVFGIPCSRRVLGVVEGGFLSDVQVGAVLQTTIPLQVWDPQTGRVLRTLEATEEDLEAVSPEVLLYSTPANRGCPENCQYVTYVESITTGKTSRFIFRAPRGMFITGSEPSPTGTRFAVLVVAAATERRFAAVNQDSIPPVLSGPGRLLIFSLRTGHLMSTRTVSVASTGYMQWSPNGHWVFAAASTSSIGVYSTVNSRLSSILDAGSVSAPLGNMGTSASSTFLVLALGH
ncbi:MAG: hypothetical protein ACYCSF_00940 [Acidimicrobiales bacterium]